MKILGSSQKETQAEHDTYSEIAASEDVEVCHVVNNLIDPTTRSEALQKYIFIGECFYQAACHLDSKVLEFEQNIHRPYFHVKPLDDKQLHNWHRYLDLIEMDGDFDWAVKLYERCLISCAHYPEFWMRYVGYVDSKGGREIAIDALERATLIYLKNDPGIHLFSAWFKEKIGDVDGARAAFLQSDQDLGSYFIDSIRRKANMERRMGNYAKASSIYTDALDFAAEKKPEALPMLYVNFARLQYMITKGVEATEEILLNGIRRVPHSKVLLKELILFALMHDRAKQVDLMDSVLAQELAPASDVSGGLSSEDREDISKLYLEFIDSCGSIDDIRRAWNRHVRTFPHLIRVQSSLKKPSKAVAYTLTTDLQKSTKEDDKNHLIQQSPSTKLLTTDNIDKSEKPIHEKTVFEDGHGNLNDSELVTSKVGNSFVKDEGEANKLGTLERNREEAVNDSKSCGIQEEQEQDQIFQQKKPDLMESGYFNSREEEYANTIASLPRGCEEASLSNRSKPARGHDIDEVPSTSSPVSPRDSNAVETGNQFPCPSKMRQKDTLSTLSPEPLEKEGNQRRLNSSGKGRSRLGSPGDSVERLARSPSPRRRNSHGYSEDRRHRERSLSPRRHNSRWQSEDRWHRDRRHRRFSRYQDNSRNHRDGRMQNQYTVTIGNKMQTETSQQQSTGSVSQTLLPVHPVAYPQAQANQYPLPSNEQYGNAQNSTLYNHMWQYYYYNNPQQQLLPRQTSLSSQQQLQQMQPLLQLQQQMQNPAQQQHIQTLQSPQTPPHPQQLLQVPYQQQQLYLQSQLQQQQTEQPQFQQQQLQLQQQMQLPQQQLYLQQQQTQQEQQQAQQVHIQQPQQTQLQQQEDVYVQQQQQQQQQQSYQYQHVQQQQYLVYLQQLHQYQQSLQQPGLAPDQKSFQQQQKLPEEEQKELPELQHRNDKSQLEQDDGSAQVNSADSPQQQDQVKEHIHGSTSGALSHDELPEIEGTEI